MSTEWVPGYHLHPVKGVTGGKVCIFMHGMCKGGLMAINMKGIRKFINEGHLCNSIVNFNHLFQVTSPLASQSTEVIYLFIKNIVWDSWLLHL